MTLMKWRFATMSTLLLTGGLIAGDEAWHTTPDRWREPRLYHRPVQPDIADRVALGRDIAPPKIRVPATSDPEDGAPPDNGRSAERPGLSPNHAYWFAVQESVTAEGRPRMTIISIFNERPGYLQIMLKDNPRYEPQVKWINEKLLFVRVWWGRVLGDDLIIDVERETIIYREAVHSGLIPFQQWRSAREADDEPRDDDEPAR
jgi:hypothetical protein